MSVHSVQRTGQPFSTQTLASTFLIAIVTTLATVESRAAHAAELSVIDASTNLQIGGKEVDWIYGDYLMRNDRITVVIAAPLRTRDANMTVRSIGGSILDLTLNEPSNDQLSAYIPTGLRYLFQNPEHLETGEDETGVFWRCTSSRNAVKDDSTATITYRLNDGESFVTATVELLGDKVDRLAAFDGVRADGVFAFEQDNGMAVCVDSFFRQTIGFQTPSANVAPSWKRQRPMHLQYSEDQSTKADGRVTWTVRLYPATSKLDLSAAISDAAMQTFQVVSELPGHDGQSVLRAEITIEDSSGNPLGVLQTDDKGVAMSRLVPGDYTADVNVLGADKAKIPFKIDKTKQTIGLPITGESGFVAKVVDGNGQPCCVKATIYRTEGDNPDLGPTSTHTFVKNCVYSVDGSFRCGLSPGTYEVYFSCGPEFNREIKTVDVTHGNFVAVEAVLDRVVNTTGWVSTELHSHSSPSGDNVADQYGRVENLLCENLEFAPCTEHNRISSYTPHLESMGKTHVMATCTGMELTGSILPVNHQNAFPLHHHPHTQNGGGPRVSSNPVVQIERLAMWDNESEKLVQENHPNLHQIFGDLDVDGIPDAGFKKMFQWMDVIEVDPPETIFEDVTSEPPNIRKMKIPIFQWMQLLNQGIRIPGVVNTDAHYNHHGSGWLRNWFASSTDDPAKISTLEMVRQAEAGHIVMSRGPFLSVKGMSEAQDSVAIPGDDLKASDGKVSLMVSVQCPNWMDVNRVQLFINGRPSEEHNFTRRSSPELFGALEKVVKFEHQFDVELDQDAHLIVATIGEGMTMEKVMGARYGKKPPIAVGNPIFVDVDGKGFQANGDELGLPLPRETEELREP